MGQNTRAIFGLSGVAFMDAHDRSYIGFSAKATRLTVSGGHEAVQQKTGTGVPVAAALAIADTTVEIEGITDATASMAARLRGGQLLAGSGAVNPSARASSVLPADAWGATAIAAANGKTPRVGVYSIRRSAADATAIRRVFTPDGRTVTGALGGEDASGDFAVTGIPSAVAVDTEGYFFWEPAVSAEQGEYVFGGLNLPRAVTVIGMSATEKQVDPANENFERVLIPVMQLNPIDSSSVANEYKSLGTISGMGIYSAAIGGVWTTKNFFGIL